MRSISTGRGGPSSQHELASAARIARDVAVWRSSRESSCTRDASSSTGSSPTNPATDFNEHDNPNVRPTSERNTRYASRWVCSCHVARYAPVVPGQWTLSQHHRRIEFELQPDRYPEESGPGREVGEVERRAVPRGQDARGHVGQPVVQIREQGGLVVVREHQLAA